MPFCDPLVTKVVSDGYELHADFRYRHPNTGGIIRVPAGFVTDFASIPRIARPIITGHKHSRMPAVIHDYLYAHAIGNRADADQVFRLAMVEAGMPSWKVYIAWAAVRAGGWMFWRDKKMARKSDI